MLPECIIILKKGFVKKMAELESILDLMDEALVHTDVYGNVIYFNQKFEQNFGVDRALIGDNITCIYPELKAWYAKEKVLRTLKFAYRMISVVFMVL